MPTELRDEIFNTLCLLSDRQFDQKAKARLQTFIGKPDEEVKDELLGLIDDCVYAAWSGSFEIVTMQQVWKAIGGTDQELTERNILLQDKKNIVLLKPKYKWQCQ